MTVDKLLNKVLKQIRPEQEAVLKKVDAFLKKLNTELKKQKVAAKAVVGGSIAKDTNLKGDHDCDIFVRFDYKKYKEEDISKILEKILKPFDAELVHGSRDYFQIKKQINYELVPVLDINNPKDAVNVTDMSPLHVAWVNKHPKMKDEIRLAKQFCKSVGVYGAESYINGVSGHVLDILTIHYGGFINLLKESQNWKKKEVIDPENIYKGTALKKLNRSKIDSPIIVIDPVLSERNAAAALSEEKLIKFRLAAKMFLARPDEKFFKIIEMTDKILLEKFGNDLIIIKAAPLEGKIDVVGAKLLKAFTYIRNQLNFYDFKIKQADWYWNKKDEAVFWFTTKNKTLLPLTKHVGPPTKTKKNVDMFKKKHKKTFAEKGRICTYVSRPYTDVTVLVKDTLKDKSLFKDKSKKMTLVNLPTIKKK